jgi:hypothetical protein
MKTKAVVFFILMTLLYIAACQTTSFSPEPTITSTRQPTKEITVINTPTITPSPTVTRTQKPTKIVFYQTPTWRMWQSPTATPPGFLTLTPSPYPTFIVENAVTATPAQPAVCPMENPSLVLNPDDYVVHYEKMTFIFDDSLAEMLSRGASFSQIKELFDNAGLSDQIIIKDMTNDGVDELIFWPGNHVGIISCEAEKYTSIFNSSYCIWDIVIDDLNLNGIPDLVFSYSASTCQGELAIHSYEWNGQTMEQMEEIYHGDIDNLEYLYYKELEGQNTRQLRALFFNKALYVDEGEMCGYAKMDVVDLDHNGTKEIRIKDSAARPYYLYWFEEPLRELEVIFEWNGEKYLFSNIAFSPPEYRFQAIQDADRYFLFRQYDKALAMYDAVINNITLKPWSEEYMVYLKEVDNSQNPDAIAKPVMTLDEYQQLSAYARYRIMMIQLAQGKQSEAFNTYQLLDQIYTEDNPGYAHAEIGRRYWHAVEEGQNPVEACQVVTEYMQENPDLLHALGGSLHGEQTHYYGYDDICPLDETDVELLSGGK